LAAIRRASSRVSVNNLRSSVLFRQESRIAAARKQLPRRREQEPSMDPESQEDRSTIEDRFAEQDVRRYSTWSSVIVIVGVMVVLALLYFFLR